METQAISNNVPTNLNTNTFTRENYVFKGWNTADDGSGTSYTDGQEVTNLGNITLYAQWERVYNTKYAVQIYGINQDEDENGNPLGLTFGPATGDNYNNKYVTHTYEETSPGSEEYYVKIVKHIVASDNTETTSEEYLYENGGTTTKVVRTEAEKNKYNVNMHNMTWEQIANVTDKTKFLDCMLCGDTKSVTLSLNSTIASGTTPTQYGDGAGVLYNTINSYYRKWNPRPSDNSYVGTGVTLDSNEQIYGSNARNAGAYSVSHIRATLIGENAKTNKGYAGDVNLDTSNSLYSCIESDLQNVITAKKVKYVTGSTYTSGNYSLNDDISDKIWLFSNRELYGTGNYSGNTTEGIGTSGDGYSKFGNSESKYYISSYNNSANTNRVVYQEAGTAYNWWLRSTYLSNAYYAYSVYGSGSTGINNYVYYSSGLGFGFCLQGEYQVTFNANGGTGTMASQTITNNVPTHLTTNTFTREGYSFAGWNTKEDGTGTNYTDGQEVTNLGNITLYAQWYQPYSTKYAVQIYGINQDVDSSGNPLGLTFGPAVGDNYNNKYVTHTYEETSGGSGQYYVKIVTHTVAANNTETTTTEYLKNSSGNNVIRTLAEKNKYDINMHNMTWTQIAAVSDKTDFLDCMLCGDTKSVNISLNNIIGSGTTSAQYGDGAGMLHDTVNDYYRIWNPSYNATDHPEWNNSAATNGGTQGSSAKNAGAYSSSHIRATLVGSNNKTNVTYAGNVNLSSSNSLYSCIDSDLQNVITAKKVNYVTGTNYTSGNYNLNNDISDKIWLFSNRELYGLGTFSGGTTEGLGVSGDGYSKFGNNESKYYISSYNNSNATQRLTYTETGTIDAFCLRSPHLSFTYYINIIDVNGSLNYYNEAYTPISIAFGFCIN